MIDVSGSMGDSAGASTDLTKLELARDAAIAALDQFKDEDQVGLRIFTTDIGDVAGETSLDLVPVAPMDEGQRARLRSADRGAVPAERHAAVPGDRRTRPTRSATTTTRR